MYHDAPRRNLRHRNARSSLIDLSIEQSAATVEMQTAAERRATLLEN